MFSSEILKFDNVQVVQCTACNNNLYHMPIKTDGIQGESELGIQG